MQVFERLVKPIDAAGQLVYDILAVLDQVDAVCDEEAAQSLEFTNARLRVEEAFHAIDLIMPKIMRLAGECISESVYSGHLRNTC